MAIGIERHVAGRHGQALAGVFAAVSLAAQRIEQRIRTAPLSGTLGAAGQTNVQGEQQQKLDVFANDVMIAALESLPSIAAVVSEENDEPLIFAGKPDAQYVVIFDPLDGSSNIDVDVNVGTIVSVQAIAPGQDAQLAALQPGTSQVAALYVNYGPSTMLVYTAGDGVHSFTLADGEFVLNAESLHMPGYGPYYSVNEGYAAEFPAVYREYLAALRDGSLLGRQYGSRYVGSFIADFHRTLLKGGVFLYPPTSKTPRGKLRLLYEANPLAWIAEEAGGMAVTGVDSAATDRARPAASKPTRILECVPADIHQRTTLVIGSRAEVLAFQDFAASVRFGSSR